jgi:hypothetical protein
VVTRPAFLGALRLVRQAAEPYAGISAEGGDVPSWERVWTWSNGGFWEQRRGE